MLSRIEDVQAFRKVLQHDCLDRDALEDGLTVKCQKHEIQSLKKLVDCLVGKGCDIDSWEGFFYNYMTTRYSTSNLKAKVYQRKR